MTIIRYEYRLPGEAPRCFTVDVERAGPAVEVDGRPEWTYLAYHQCPRCPLDGDRTCPVAVDIQEIAEGFADLLSHARVDVLVETEVREYQLSCDVQTGLSSLLGLVMATGGCPVLSRLQGLARFHLPGSSARETLFRTVGFHLLKQFFVARRGGDPDFDLGELQAFYDELQEVNMHLKRRLEAPSRNDANLNAVTLLFSLSAIVSLSLETELEELAEDLGI